MSNMDEIKDAVMAALAPVLRKYPGTVVGLAVPAGGDVIDIVVTS